MKVSIIVPVFNAEKYLRECIESVIAQTLGDYELILVNDGSTDNSAAICDEYSSLDSRIQVFHKPNDGPASAKNFGMERAQGEYIIFLNADDFWTNKDCLDTLVNIADSTKADIVKGEFKVIGSDGREIRKERHRKILDKKILSRKLFFGKCLDGEFSCFQFLIRRESMSGLTFDESFTFDEDARAGFPLFQEEGKMRIFREVFLRSQAAQSFIDSILQEFKSQLRVFSPSVFLQMFAWSACGTEENIPQIFGNAILQGSRDDVRRKVL